MRNLSGDCGEIRRSYHEKNQRPGGLVIVKNVLDLPVVSDGEQLFVEDGSTGRPTDTKIVEMGGVTVEKITATLAEYFPIENRSTRSRVDRYVMVADCLRLAGVDTDGKTPLTVTLETKSQRETREVAWVVPEKRAEEPAVSWERIGDVFYVDMNRCVVDEALDDICAALKKAVNGGTSKVIIDMRGNGGGNSEADDRLLHAMGMEPPQFGSQTCISPLAKYTYPDFYGSYSDKSVKTVEQTAAQPRPTPMSV